MDKLLKFDVVIPNGNEKEFIEMAEYMDLNAIAFLTDNIRYNYTTQNRKIKILKAFLVKNQDHMRKAKNDFDMVFANAERKFFERNVDFIIGLEDAGRRDSFHFRSTPLNQVHAKLAHQNNISMAFDFKTLLNADNRWKQTYLGRMKQNATLIKKYRLKSSVFSLARQPYEMRHKDTLDALSKVLGLQ